MSLPAVRQNPLAKLSLSRRRQRYARLALEALESRLLLSAFTAADVNGPWTYAATDQAGAITFDAANQITGGSLTDAANTSHTPTGAYTIGASGVFGFVDTTTRIGAMNSAKDVIAASQNNLDNTLTVLVSGGSASFSNADLSGTWNMAFNGLTSQANGSGTLTFDGNGNITDGQLSTGDSVDGGTYTVNADGTCTLSIDLSNQSGTNNIQYTGALNASKDFLALDPDLQAAAANSSPTLTVLVRTKGTYSNADIKGTWFLSAEGGMGTITLDGAGHVSSGIFVTSDNVASSVTGTYAVAANGTFSVNIAATSGGVTQHLLQTGAINASRNILIENQNGTTHADNLSILINSTPRNPSLTTVVPFYTAVAGQPFAISYDQLLNHADAVDSNGQPLQFQITSLASGALTIDGNAVSTFPALVLPGDNLTWTSSATASGPIAAFSMKAFDGTTLSTTAVAVTIDTIIPGPFPASLLTDLWHVAGTGSAGTVIFDGTDSITGGTVANTSGDTGTPTGTFLLKPNGHLTISTGPSDTQTGAFNASHDVAAFAGDGGFNVILNSQNANFSNADLSGAWTIAVNGDTIDSNGVGSLNFDGNGHISSGTFKNGVGSQSITGTYALSADGSLSVNIVSPHNGGFSTITLTGAMNNSKDVIALDPPDLIAAANHSDSNLIMLVHSAGTYSNADAKGTWTVAGDGTTGQLTLDGAGHIANGVIFDKGRSGVVTGTYSVSASGAWTLNAIVNREGTLQTQTFTGALNKSHNTIIMNAISSNPDNADNLNILINSADHAPTLTTVGPLAFLAGFPDTLTYSKLLAASNAADLDGDGLQFQITSLTANGTLTQNGTPITLPFSFTASSDPLTWIPASTAALPAFSVKAFDGTLSSPTALPVTIKTVAIPVIAIAASKPAASEINGSTTGLGQYTLTRTGGITNESLSVTLAISGTATNGTDYSLLDTHILFGPGQLSTTVNFIPLADSLAEGTETVVVTVVPSDQSVIYTVSPTKPVANFTIADAANTVSAAVTKATASEINGTTTGAGVITLTRSGGSLAGPLTVTFSLTGAALAGTNYTLVNSTSVAFDTLSSTGTVTFGAGKASVPITLNPINDLTVNTPPLTALLTLTDNNNTYFINNAKSTSTLTLADAASAISVAVTKATASEVNGTTTGAGILTFTRTGGDLSRSLTVNFTLSGSATESSDYATLTPHSVTFAPTKTTATLTINPKDDVTTEGPETVIVTLAPDANPSYSLSLTKPTAGTLTIADDLRPLITGPIDALGTAHTTLPFVISYDTLLAATHAQARTGTITFKITKVLTGILQKDSVNVTPGITTLSSGESLAFTAVIPGSPLSAFPLTALNGTNLSPTLTILIQATA